MSTTILLTVMVLTLSAFAIQSEAFVVQQVGNDFICSKFFPTGCWLVHCCGYYILQKLVEQHCVGSFVNASISKWDSVICSKLRLKGWHHLSQGVVLRTMTADVAMQ